MIHDHYKLYRNWRSMGCICVYDVVGGDFVASIDVRLPIKLS